MVNPTAPAQDDDAELVERLRFEHQTCGRHSGEGYGLTGIIRLQAMLKDAADRIEQLSSISPTPETGLVEALKRIRSISQRKDMSAAAKVACIGSIAHSSLSNVLPDEVGAQPLEQPPATR